MNLLLEATRIGLITESMELLHTLWREDLRGAQAVKGGACLIETAFDLRGLAPDQVGGWPSTWMKVFSCRRMTGWKKL
jgi:hypothetical protein